MRSTTLTICLAHIMCISFVRGFIILPSPSSSLHRHAATRQDDLLASGSSSSSKTRAVTTASSRRRPTPSRSVQNNNNSNQYTQFFKENVLVGIQRTSLNSRRISGEMIMNIPIDTIWSILTDYDNLSVHVPNLVESRVISNGGRRRRSTPRVYQRGAQRIFGFEFGADVTMDMTEHVHLLASSSSPVDNEGMLKQCVIDFKCVDSQFFSEFDGSWIVEEYKDDNGMAASSPDGEPITMVRYVVDVRPKGPVPVAALEWRIKEDVPVNILAVSKAATAAMARDQQQRNQNQRRSLVDTVSQAASRSTQSLTAPSSPRRRSPRPLQPIQRLTNQAANNFKRTAKTVLPSPVYSTAKQAVNIINNNLSRRPRHNDVPTFGDETRSDFKTTNTVASSDGITSKEMDVDWYDDETMAMYL